MMSPIGPNPFYSQEVTDSVTEEDVSLLPKRNEALREANLALKEEIERYCKENPKRKKSIGESNLIFESISLGSLKGCEQHYELASHAKETIHIVISVTNNEPEVIKPENIERLAVPIPMAVDPWTCENGIKKNLRKTFELIDRARLEKTPLLIHCDKGSSRSGTLLIAYLMWSTELPFQQVLNYARSKRFEIFPDEGLTRVLKEEFSDMIKVPIQ